MRSILLEDRQKTLDTVTCKILKMLKAESCAIFLVPDNQRDLLVLESSITDKQKESRNSNKISLQIQSVEGQGLTGHIANQGKIVNLSFKKLQTSNYVKSSPHHLKSKQCFSLLAVPLKDRKKRLLGLLKVENKKGIDGNANEMSHFTAIDQLIAKILANKVVIVLDNLRTHDVLQGLLQDAQSDLNYNVILENILRRAVSFMRADRGDLALWSEQKSDLIFASVNGETVNPAVRPGSRVPTLSIIRTAWNKTRRPPVVARKVILRKDYFEINFKTQSEAAIRLHSDGRPVGVLNLESFYSNGFDKKDLENLHLISNCVSIAVRKAAKHTSFPRSPLRTINEISLEFSADWSDRKSLNSIFTAIQASGFDRARIYKYDTEKKEFTCMGSYEQGVQDLLQGKINAVEENPYAKDMVDTYLNNTRVRIYDPTDPLSFGEDPNAALFGKPKDLPWAAAPLIVDNELYGHITADNKVTRKAITEENLEYLNLIAVQISRSLTECRISQLTNLMETVPDYIYFKDLESRFLRISNSMTKYFKITDPKEAEGKTDFDYFEANYAKQKFADEQRIIRTGEPMKDHEEPDFFKKGGQGWVSTTKMPLKTTDGVIIGTYGISRDITHRKNNQEMVKQANIELREIQEALQKANSRLDMQLERASEIAHFGFWEWDIYAETGKVKATNGVYPIFGLAPQQDGVKLADLRSLVHPDFVHVWDENFSISALAKPFAPFEIQLQFPGKTIKHLYAKSEFGRVDQAGLPETIIGFVQDVTEQKKEEMRTKGLELAVQGFQHMIPGKADEAISGLELCTLDDSAAAAISNASRFIFLIRHKADEVRSLRYDRPWFRPYTLGEIWDNSWSIALDLVPKNREHLKIIYSGEINDSTPVNGGFYTAAVNILSNTRRHGTPPALVWLFVLSGKLTAIFADGGPNPTKHRAGKMDPGVGLRLVKRILEIIGGTIHQLTSIEFLARHENLKIPNEINSCQTFFQVQIPN